MSKAKLFEKYGKPSPAGSGDTESEWVPAHKDQAWVPDPSPQVLTCWQDSEVVSALSEILGKYADHGCRLVWTPGGPSIRFTPGLSLDDSPERWEFAGYIVGLALDARTDLFFLIRNRMLSLPVV